MKIRIPPLIFEKYSNTKFLKNSSSGSRVVSCRRKDSPTDRQTGRQTNRNDEADSRFSKFWERV